MTADSCIAMMSCSVSRSATSCVPVRSQCSDEPPTTDHNNYSIISKSNEKPTPSWHPGNHPITKQPMPNCDAREPSSCYGITSKVYSSSSNGTNSTPHSPHAWTFGEPHD